MVTVERKGTFKLEFLKKLEADIQRSWANDKLFEEDAPTQSRTSEDEKYFCTFPFPYMNGRLHLGHTFSLSKTEFATRYHRLKGKKVLFPFGFHCTGMPIKASADKLKREMEQFGFPPKFPQEQTIKVEEEEDVVPKDKSKGKKSKAVAKSISTKYQWQIMYSLGLNDDEIKQFANAEYWLDYFPPLAVQDLTKLGLHVDWRRTFITTDLNPFFDSFVRWQFIRLKERNKIQFGKRYTIYSVRDGQPCMDHDRSTGEGVGPQEYTLIKIKLLKPYPEKLQKFEGKEIFFVAATLRPETMYGQTNCWVHPDIKYVVFETKWGDVFICTSRSAKNMSYQEFTVKEGFLKIDQEILGHDILGCALKAPLSGYEKIYSLPMLTIKEDKGTGIVTSVPSDSPDDYAALVDLKNKPAFREKYGLTAEMVQFEPLPIIDVPSLGNLSAVTLYNELKIQSQNDREKLQQAKEMVYLKGFYDGVLLVGEYKGRKVQDVKKILQNALIDINEAVIYYEPEKTVMSRSGEECIVALCDQWYLDYGQKVWKEMALEALEGINTYHEEVKKNFNFCVNWLHEYACSRRYGLGSKLPWDEQWLIESLSDSTIYNAYYTVAHLLQGNTFRGNTPNSLNVKAEQLTPEVWDYVFFKDAVFPENTLIKKECLDQMKREFNFWYPVDVRVSGKDLIQNHLTYFIYNHCAIWPKEADKWPKSIRANGHLLLNSAKMSKSEGNFLTLSEAIEKFSADGTRFCLADAGDSIEDANFVESCAESAILRLYTFVEWVKDMLKNRKDLRTGPLNTFNDQVFQSEINLKIKETDQFYNKMLFKEALRTGFFELQLARDKYRELSLDGMHIELILRFIQVQALLLAPICPHVCEFVWGLLGHKTYITKANWPSVGSINEIKIKASEYLMESAHSFRLYLKTYLQANKTKKINSPKSKPNMVNIWVAKTFPPWQTCILKTLKTHFEKDGTLPDNKILAMQFAQMAELKKFMKKVMPFVQAVREKVEKFGVTALALTLEFDEAQVLRNNALYLANTLEMDEVFVKFTDDEDADEKVKMCCPGSPFVEFFSKPGIEVEFFNPVPMSSLFSHVLTISDEDSFSKVVQKLRRNIKTIKSAQSIELWKFENPSIHERKLPIFNDHFKDKVKIPSNSTFKINLEERKVSVFIDSKSFDLGNTVMYVVI